MIFCPRCYSDDVSRISSKKIDNQIWKCHSCDTIWSRKDLFDESSYEASPFETEDIYASVGSEYNILQREFDNALQQASAGKGKERHARGKENFDDQVMCAVQRLLIDHPCGGLAYQVIKKTIESGRLFNDKGVDAAKKEIYGAMNYLGGMGIIYGEQFK